MAETDGFFRKHSTLSKPDRANVNIGVQLDPLVQRLYSLAIYDTIENRVVNSSELDPAAKLRGDLAEYFFRVPPKTYEMNEPTTTHIVYTQNGGRFVESHGSLTKDIRLVGTTGLRPNKVAPQEIALFSAIRNLASPTSLVKRSTVPIDREATGFDDIIFLRNLFRFYSDRKHSGEVASRTLFLFRNAKDDDYWVVEPMEFKLTQNSSSPLTYEYNILLKTLGKFDYELQVPPDPLAAMRAKQRALFRMQRYLRDIGNAFFILDAAIARVQGRVAFALTSILNPMLAVMQGLRAVKSSTVGLTRYLQSDITRLKNEAKRFVDEMSAAPRFIVDNAGGTRATRSNRLILRTVLRMVSVSSSLLRETFIRPNSGNEAQSRRSRAVKAYTTSDSVLSPGYKPDTGGSSAFLGNQPDTRVVASGTVFGGETIKDTAQRLLGDRARWHTLVVLNGLVFPYISADGGEGVLRPGDPILYPSGEENGTLLSQTQAQQVTSEETTNPVVDAYGTDVRLTTVDDGGTDFVVSSTGDLALVRGVSNVDQAIRLKFATEQGELAAHPKYGTRFPIGTRATTSSFNEYRINAQSTLLSDPRVKNILSLNFGAVGDALEVTAQLSLVGTTDAFDTDFVVRR